MKLNETEQLDYNKVFIYPQYSGIISRTQVDTSVELTSKHVSDFKLTLQVPVISANMDTVTDATAAIAMSRAGGIGAIHRFMSIEENVEQFKRVAAEGASCFVSVGVNQESRERAGALYNAGARKFVIDIAHGHSLMMNEMLEWMRFRFHDVFIMAGNIATFEGARDLFTWGADAVKIGIGPGAVCTTKNVTGVTVPQFGAVMNVCNNVFKEQYRKITPNPILVADGGIQEIGDIAKALGAGADLVMSGRLFASCQEAPGPRINGQKVYRGMASKDAMLTIKDAAVLPTPEGISTVLEISGETMGDVVKHIKGGLQSSLSYSNARNLREFTDNVRFGVRK
jgi:IMP dehydrogenase